MKTFSNHYLAIAFGLNLVWQSLGLFSAQASSPRLQKSFSQTIIAQQPYSPSSLDFSSFFETGRVRSQDRILFQRPRDEAIPVSPQSNSWQFIIFRAGGCSFWMPPGILTEETVKLDTSLGQLSFRTLASNSDERRFVAAYADSLTQEQLKNPQVLLKAIQERVAPAKKFQLKQQRSITIKTYPGRELTFENAEEMITMRVYLVEQKIYALGVSEPKVNPLPRQTRAFLNAFELLD